MSALAQLGGGFQQGNGLQLGGGFQQKQPQMPQMGGGFQAQGAPQMSGGFMQQSGPQLGGGYMQQQGPQMGGGFQANSPLAMLGQYRQGMSQPQGDSMPGGVYAPHMGGAMRPGMIPNTPDQVLKDFQPRPNGMPQMSGGLSAEMGGMTSPLLPQMSGGFRDGR